MKTKGNMLLEFSNFIIDQVEFKANPVFFSDPKRAPVDLEVSFQHDLSINGKNITRSLDCCVFDNTFMNGKAPYFIHLTIVGFFSIDDFDKDNPLHISTAKMNTLVILFPYLRACISNLTVMTNLPPLILPPMNILSLLDKEIPPKEK